MASFMKHTSPQEDMVRFTKYAILSCGSRTWLTQKMRSDNSPPFARKLIRLFAGVTRQDISDEAIAVTKLCGKGMNRFVVEVLQHGWLPRNLIYFIDMEYCDESLEDEILVMARQP